MNSILPTEDFRNWLPTKLYRADGESVIDWSYFENVRFTEPFFESTIVFRKRDENRQPLIYRTSLNFLKYLHEKSPGIEPTGFIFHVSRCGSTLISQMLAATDKNIVISEAPPVDAVIRGLHDGDRECGKRAEHLKWLLSAYGQKRFAAETHFFIKFDCWHTIDLELINKAFPEVPWIFLYRNPIEVVVSHLRQRGMQMIPGVIENLLPDLEFDDVLQISAEEYCARVLERICASALNFAEHPNALFINYSELPQSVFTRVFKHFNVNYEPSEIVKIWAATNRNAKMPQAEFKPDAGNKRAEASAAVKKAVAAYAAPVYEKLERLRMNA